MFRFKFTHQTRQTANTKNPHTKNDVRSISSSTEASHEQSISDFVHNHVPALDKLDTKVQLLLSFSDRLMRMDEQSKEVLIPLSEYKNGVSFGHIGDAGIKWNEHSKKIILNFNVVRKISQLVDKEHLHLALMVYLCHEVSHLSQNIKSHNDVIRMKMTDLDDARDRVGELDLRSDFLAVHTISLLLTLHNKGENNQKVYVAWFHKIWNDLCRKMLATFSKVSRLDKKKRVFGHLLMSYLIREAYLKNKPLEFDAELWPVWSQNLDRLTLYSKGRVFNAGSPVDAVIMQEALEKIEFGEYSNAEALIGTLWNSFPRS